MFNGTQRLIDRAYEDRMRGGSPRFTRFYSTVDVDYQTQQADKKLGTILAEFSEEQFAEYLQMTTNHNAAGVTK